MLQCMQVLQCGAAQWCCSAMLLCGVECGEQDFAQVLQLKHVLQCGVAVCREVRGAESRDTHIYQCAYGVTSISRLLKIIGLFCERALSNRQ